MANASAGGGVIVVLASGGEKVAVDRRFKASVAVEHLYGTKVVFRSGSPQNVHDLRQCNAAHAKSIVILSIGESPTKADANTLRILMALTVIGGTSERHVVAEVRDPEMVNTK